MSDIVPAKPAAPALLEHGGFSFVAQPGLRVDQLPSTLPRDQAGLIRRMNAMGSSTIDMDRSGSVLLNLADVLCYWRAATNEETGEEQEFSWLVLMDDKGERWGTSSPVVASKIAQICCLWDADLLPRPLAIQIVTRTAQRSGRRYHDVVLLQQSGGSDGPTHDVAHEPSARPVVDPSAESKRRKRVPKPE